MEKKLKGLVPPMLTVFKKDESFDEQGTRRFVNFLIEKGAQGLIPCGSSGEFITMTLEERKRVAEVVVDEVSGRVPVFVATGHASTKLCIELSKHAESIGADGVMVIVPYYLRPTQKQICEHYRAVANSINIPLMIYNNVWFSGVELPPKTIAELYKEGVVSYVKEAHGDPSRIHDLRYYCGDDLGLFYGHDVCALEGLSAGADGWISGIPNLLPEHSRRLCDLILVEKDLEGARELWWKMLPLIHMVVNKKAGEQTTEWRQVFKEGLNMRGQAVGTPRMPTLPLSTEDRTNLETELRKLDLIL